MNKGPVNKEKRVCLGVFGAPHGVAGAVRVKTFTANAEDVGAYGTVETEDGARQFDLRVIRDVKPGIVIVKAPQIKSREDAATLTNKKFYIDRDRLPAPDDPDDFYVEDLVGLSCFLEDGAPAGKVAAVHDFGAGDLLEIRGAPQVKAKGGRLVRFAKALVPVVDIAGGRLTLAADAFDEGIGEPEPQSPPHHQDD